VLKRAFAASHHTRDLDEDKEGATRARLLLLLHRMAAMLLAGKGLGILPYRGQMVAGQEKDGRVGMDWTGSWRWWWCLTR
jgi:hypothetical protein